MFKKSPKKKKIEKNLPLETYYLVCIVYNKRNIFFYEPLKKKKLLLKKMSSKTKIQNKWKIFSF